MFGSVLNQPTPVYIFWNYFWSLLCLYKSYYKVLFCLWRFYHFKYRFAKETMFCKCHKYFLLISLAYQRKDISEVNDRNNIIYSLNIIVLHIANRSWRLCVCVISFDVNPLHARFFRGNKNTYSHFISFFQIDMTQVVEIISQVSQEVTYSPKSKSWQLVYSQRKAPGHQQPWYWLCWTELIWSPHVHGLGRNE